MSKELREEYRKTGGVVTGWLYHEEYYSDGYVEWLESKLRDVMPCPPDYPELKDGETIRVDMDEQVLYFACCDCGLVHTFEFSHIKDGKWNFIVSRNEKETKLLMSCPPEWKGCDTCKHSDKEFRTFGMTCDNKNSTLGEMSGIIDETTSCIHHSEGIQCSPVLTNQIIHDEAKRRFWLPISRTTTDTHSPEQSVWISACLWARAFITGKEGNGE